MALIKLFVSSVRAGPTNHMLIKKHVFTSQTLHESEMKAEKSTEHYCHKALLHDESPC